MNLTRDERKKPVENLAVKVSSVPAADEIIEQQQERLSAQESSR
jgi:hypothetical protein